jgi:hypothetical protein
VAASARAGELALHALPPDEAMVDTLFIRRRDGYVTSALRAFTDLMRGCAAEPIQSAAE